MVQHLWDRQQAIPLVVLPPGMETPTVRLPPPPLDLPSSSLHSNNNSVIPLAHHNSSSNHHRLRRTQGWEELWSYRINKAIRTPKRFPHSSSSNSYICTPRSSSSRWCQRPLPRPPILFRYSKVHRHQLRSRLLLPQTRLLFRLKPQRNSNPMVICGAI